MEAAQQARAINPNWAYLIILVTALVSAAVIYLTWTSDGSEFGYAL
jgi:hypothetical protein